MRSVDLLFLGSFGFATLWAQEQSNTNPHAALIQDFGKRVSDYVKLRHKLEAGEPRLKPTPSPEAILHHERELARKIRRVRAGAKQGEVFTPEITGEFRRLVGLAMQGKSAAHVHDSLKNAEPVRPILRVNEPYPAKVPLQSTPPSILLNLPGLPPELEYRIAGHSLALRDAKANLIVDIAPDVIP